MRKESETPSGIRLMLLLKGHLREIMNRECANQTSIHLYCTGSYWVAFERSAYQLRRAIGNNDVYRLSFSKPGTSADAPWIIIECRKQGETSEGQQTMLIGEITNVWIK